jgi:phosphoribosylamine--glycine ligase
MMKVLVVGGGGREHAIASALARDPAVTALLAAPGNPGIARLARCLPIAADDLPGLVAAAERERVDLVVVGPEAPLVRGLADRLRGAGIPTFGPSAAAARLEGSKALAKTFMREHGIPTAEAEAFTDPSAAAARVRELGAPIVIKADGLAAGKGVVVAGTVAEALAAIDRFLVAASLGPAGARILVERCMIGEEVTLFALSDGERWLLLPPAQDHKRLEDGDEGPNTGGMGACAPVPLVDSALQAEIEASILAPTIEGLRDAGTPFIGCLYLGLMLEADGPRVVEYNVRLGDPEAQVVLPVLGPGLAQVLAAAAAGALPRGAALPPSVPGCEAAACVVLAAPGYPAAPVLGQPIRGLERFPAVHEAGAPAPIQIFHAGTARRGEDLVTAGGRVLGVTGLGRDLPEALARAYQAAEAIEFEGKQMRRDIGQRCLARRV